MSAEGIYSGFIFHNNIKSLSFLAWLTHIKMTECVATSTFYPDEEN